MPLPPTTCPALGTPEIAARVRARLAETQAELSGRPVADPLATIWRGMAVCGHCGARLSAAPAGSNGAKGAGRRYACRGSVRADPVTGHRAGCPGGGFSMAAAKLDPAGWADVLAWLSNPENVERLLEDW